MNEGVVVMDDSYEEAEVSRPRRVPNKNKLTKAMKLLDELPMLPKVVASLMTLSASDPNFFEKVVTLAEEDPPLGAKLMQLANAPSQAPVEPILSLHHAVTRIGTKRVASLLSTVTVMRVFVPSSEDQRDLWRHALSIAVYCRKIASMNAELRIDPEVAYLCGMMHDIGRFVMLDLEPNELNKIFAAGWSASNENNDEEFEILGYDHTMLGEAACRKWNLPDTITTVVRHHHNHDYPTNTTEQQQMSNLIRVVQLAESFEKLIKKRPQVIDSDTSLIENLLDMACIPSHWKTPPVSAKQMAPHVPQMVKDSEALVKRLGI